VRLFSRVRRAPLKATALVATAATILAAASIMTVVSTEAVAQIPTISIPPDAMVAPLSSAQKSAIRTQANLAAGRESFVAAKQLKAEQTQAVRTRVVALAKAQIGDTYSAGATGPNRFDCSGLTRYVFKMAAGKDLPHQSHAQYAKVKKIKLKDAKPGDLVFFFRNGAHHVGIYIGNKHMVDAVGYGSGVRISPITGSWWSSAYSGVGRILAA
jgi:cell wall-associated NlpC family hydrolase